MRQLLPESRPLADGELAACYGRVTGVRLNMISSADGAASAGGLSGALGGAGDKRVFAALRSLADVVLVGAGTWRAEGYGPSRVPIAVVTSTAQLDWSQPFFTEPKARPLVVTVAAAPEETVALAREVADVVVAGETQVDLTQAVAALHQRGFNAVLAEGGPTLGAQLAATGILDELCLTLSPRLIAGDGPRILEGPALPAPVELEMVHVLEEDGFLFLRYRRGGVT